MSKKDGVTPATEERISGDDLDRARFTMEQKRAADIAWEQELAYLTQRYKLAEDDKVDIGSGVITRIRHTDG